MSTPQPTGTNIYTLSLCYLPFLIFSHSANLLPSYSFSLPSTISHIPFYFNSYSYSLTLLTYFTPILSLCHHPTFSHIPLLFQPFPLIFSHSANLLSSCSFSLDPPPSLIFPFSSNHFLSYYLTLLTYFPPILSLCHPPSLMFPYSSNHFLSYYLTLLTYFPLILSLCHPPSLIFPFTLTISLIFSHSANLLPSYSFSLPSNHSLMFPTRPTIFLIFSYSANLLPSNSFSLLSTPVSHIHLFFQPFCLILSHSCFLTLLFECKTLMFSNSVNYMQDPHVLSLCYLHAGPSCALTLLLACKTLMCSHSATGMQDPHVLSLCYWHAGPSCSLTLRFACRTLMLCHSANCMQDPHFLSLC
jgi:hypothetical protein